MKAYRVKGTTDEVTECALCGKQELKGTVVLSALDLDGNEDAVCYFGVSCAAKAAGWTQREVRAGIKVAKDAERERVRAERDAMWAAERKFLEDWYMTNYGTTDLCEAAERAGKSAVELSGEAIHAYREFQRADDQPAPCPVLSEQGNMHLMGRCVECDARRMTSMTPDTVDGWYRSGGFGQVAFEAYMYAWATSATRFGTEARIWAQEPTDPAVIKFVAAIRRQMTAKQAA